MDNVSGPWSTHCMNTGICFVFNGFYTKQDLPVYMLMPLYRQAALQKIEAAHKSLFRQ